MNSSSENNKKIVKNTFALYFRQIITTIVALFVFRIVLQTLGVTDYGINNLIYGFVGLLSFLSGALTTITQRFASVELGKGGNLLVLRKIFSTSLILNIAIAALVFVFAQTLGLWLLNNTLVIPQDRIIAANWVYQFTVFSFLLTLLSVPFAALIFSHEDMRVFGYLGVFDAVTRLVTVYLLVIVNADKLILFALLGFVVSCMIWLFYLVYCRKKYAETRFSLNFDKSLLKEFFGYGKYVFASNFFTTLNTHGMSVILNLFFGTTVNAAKGIATSVSAALMSLGNSFEQSLNPQLMKLQSQNNSENTWDSVERGTRILYFLFFVFSSPLLLRTEFALNLWLGEIPDYTVIFTRLIIVGVLTNSLIYTLETINHATGKIAAFSCVNYIFSALGLALAYFAVKAGFEPYYVFVIPLILFPISMSILCFVMKKQVNFPILYFASKALLPIFLTSAISFLPFYFINKLFLQSFWHSCFVISASMLWTGIVVAFVGLKKSERAKIIAFVKRKVGK